MANKVENNCRNCVNYQLPMAFCKKLGIAKANDFHGCDYYGKDLHDARNLLALLRKMVNDTKQPTEVK